MRALESVCMSVCLSASDSPETVEVVNIIDCLRDENASRVSYIDLDLH